MYEARGGIGIHVTIRTIRSLGKLKQGNNEAAINWLKHEGIYVKADRWRTARTKTVRVLVDIHPGLTWKEDLKRDLEEGMILTICSLEERHKWQKVTETDEMVPAFEVIQEKKSFGMEKSRVTTQVVSIETKVEDADFMKYMMRKVAKQGKMRGTFIEAGYHLTTSPKVLIHVLNA